MPGKPPDGQLPGSVRKDRSVREGLKDWVYRVGVLRLEPGDVLVVRVVGHISSEQIAGLKNYLAPAVGDAKILVLDDTFDLSVLTKAEIEGRAAA